MHSRGNSQQSEYACATSRWLHYRPVQGSKISMNVNLTMQNPGPNYLDASDSVLPGVYMLMLGII